MFNIGPLELLVILIVVLIVFGPNRLPEVARAMGKAVNEFKKATNSAQQALNDVTKQIADAESEDKEESAAGTVSKPEDLLKAVQQEQVQASGSQIQSAAGKPEDTACSLKPAVPDEDKSGEEQTQVKSGQAVAK